MNKRKRKKREKNKSSISNAVCVGCKKLTEANKIIHEVLECSGRRYGPTLEKRMRKYLENEIERQERLENTH